MDLLTLVGGGGAPSSLVLCQTSALKECKWWRRVYSRIEFSSATLPSASSLLEESFGWSKSREWLRSCAVRRNQYQARKGCSCRYFSPNPLTALKVLPEKHSPPRLKPQRDGLDTEKNQKQKMKESGCPKRYQSKLRIHRSWVADLHQQTVWCFSLYEWL